MADVKNVMKALECTRPCNRNCELLGCEYFAYENGSIFCKEDQIKEDALEIIKEMHDRKKKVTYIINDYVFFLNELTDSYHLEYDEALNIVDYMEPFECMLVLEGTESSNIPDRYKLYDKMHKPMNINSLNGYQKGCIINECYKHYAGNAEKPFGVIAIS